MDAGQNKNDLVPKRNSTSVVWEYFGFRREDVSQSKVICKTCEMIIPTKRSNTTNLFQHLKQRHKKLHDQCMSTKSIETNKSTHQSQPEQTEQVLFKHLQAPCLMRKDQNGTKKLPMQSPIIYAKI